MNTTKCNACDQQITWDGRPNNAGPPNEVTLGPDGVNYVISGKHNCPNYKGGSKSSGGGASVTPEQALAECISFHQRFGDVDAARFESLAKIYISRRMSK